MSEHSEHGWVPGWRTEMDAPVTKTVVKGFRLLSALLSADRHPGRMNIRTRVK